MRVVEIIFNEMDVSATCSTSELKNIQNKFNIRRDKGCKRLYISYLISSQNITLCHNPFIFTADEHKYLDLAQHQTCLFILS